MIDSPSFRSPWPLLTLAALVALAGCAPPQRTEPPAPIVEGRRSAPEPAPASEPPPAEKAPEPTRVYAYQPPDSGTDSAAAEGASPVARDGASATGPGAEAGRRAEAPGATPGTAGAPDSRPAGASPVASASQAPAGPSPSPPPDSTAPPAAAPAPETQAASTVSVESADLTPAVDALVRQAERQRQSSDYAGAAATLERALRLQSREAYLWNRLAHVRLEQGLATQASNLAARANDLAGDRASLRRDNWLVIASARRRAGDLQGAEEAERKASGG